MTVKFSWNVPVIVTFDYDNGMAKTGTNGSYFSYGVTLPNGEKDFVNASEKLNEEITKYGHLKGRTFSIVKAGESSQGADGFRFQSWGVLDTAGAVQGHAGVQAAHTAAKEVNPNYKTGEQPRESALKPKEPVDTGKIISEHVTIMKSIMTDLGVKLEDATQAHSAICDTIFIQVVKEVYFQSIKEK